jgi:hypothetical protein
LVLRFRPATRGRCDETYEIQSCRDRASRRPEPGPSVRKIDCGSSKLCTNVDSFEISDLEKLTKTQRKAM